MIAAVSILLFAGVLAFVLLVRPKDLPEAPPLSPTQHLDERKVAIYENLRDLNFEYRLGKLSDDDYQKAKTGLQQELAKVMASIDEVLKGAPAAAAARTNSPTRVFMIDEVLKGAPAAAAAAVPAPKTKVKAKPHVCPHCGAGFDHPMKFCGECGKPMEAEA